MQDPLYAVDAASDMSAEGENSGAAAHAPRRYLTLSQACQILGVSDTTLRDWTDAGKIKAFVTPGGHRRYAESELNAFLDAQPKVKRLPDLIEQLKTMRVEYHVLTYDYARTRLWYSKMDEHVRSRLRDRCRELLDLMVRHLTDSRQRKNTAELASGLGRSLGADLAQVDFTLTEAIEAFILYRNPTLDTVAELLKSTEPVDRSVVRGIQAINAIIDNVLLGIVAQYQAEQGQPGSAAILESDL